jgi:hypothetical protein
MLNSEQNEIWLPMVEFPTLYKVSNLGNIASYRQVLSKSLINSGYHRVTLKVNRQPINRLVHRVVALAFLPNEDNKAEVNHKDGNKLNNCVDNLEWATSSENKQHAKKELGVNYATVPMLGQKQPGSPTRYHNVVYDSSRRKWIGVVRHNGKNYYAKRFNTDKEAAVHVNWILDTLQLYDRPRNIV